MQHSRATICPNHIATGLLLVSCLLLSACSTTAIPRGHSLAAVEKTLAENFPIALLPPQTSQEDSLSASAAVQLLLQQSPKVRAAIARLGIADAQQLQAELINNPHISIGAMKPDEGGRWQLDAGLSQPLLALFTRPLRRELAQENLLLAQQQLQAQLQALVVQTQRDYYRAVATQQHVQVQQQVWEAARAQQQLALSLYRAGNMAENTFLYYDNELRRVEQQLNAFKQTAQEKRLQLFNLIGLQSTADFTLPTQLPLPGDDIFVHRELMAIAKQQRLDLRIAQQQLTLLEKRRHLIKNEYGWRDISLGINAEREFDGATNIGPAVEFSLPVFNRGQGALAGIDAQVSRLQAELQQRELDMDLQIASALSQLKTAQQQLTLLTQSLAVAQQRVALASREVNFMLSSPLELLAIKRDEIQLAHDYTDELNRYWQARSQLELAIGQALPLIPREHKEHHHHD